jgi:hypothetical protein
MAALWKRCFGIAVVVACMVGSQGIATALIKRQVRSTRRRTPLQGK